MVLTNREKTSIIVSHLVSSYSENMRNDAVSQNQSVIDFVLKNIPEAYKQDLSMDLIDDVISFVSGFHMELS
jgi:hypothetical protein